MIFDKVEIKELTSEERQHEDSIIKQAIEIQSRRNKEERYLYDISREQWIKNMHGKFFKHRHVSGASDDAFEVCRVKFESFNNIELETVGYYHQGHYFIGRDVWSYDDQSKYEGCEEITREEYYEWMKFLLFKIRAEVGLDFTYWHNPNRSKNK